MPGQRLGEGALAGAVGPHDGVHFARAHDEVEALHDLGAADLGAETLHFEQHPGVLADHPTLPSSFMPRSLVASTANSIGSCWNTSRQKPLMIIDTASSAPMPRLAK